jgi:hypothetical protein
MEIGEPAGICGSAISVRALEVTFQQPPLLDVPWCAVVAAEGEEDLCACDLPRDAAGAMSRTCAM